MGEAGAASCRGRGQATRGERRDPGAPVRGQAGAAPALRSGFKFVSCKLIVLKDERFKKES